MKTWNIDFFTCYKHDQEKFSWIQQAIEPGCSDSFKAKKVF